MTASILTCPDSQRHTRSEETSVPGWVRELQQAFTDPQELLTHLQLAPNLLPAATAAAATFPLRVPRSFVARMRKGDADDPLLRQVLPLADELNTVDGYGYDPVGDLGAYRGAGLLHKYHGRALLVTTGACAVHCRFCFRRHFPYAENSSHRGEWDAALATIAADPTLEEVILSGGDPLSLSDAKLAELSRRIESIRHVRRLRIHTRQIVVLPQRVDDRLLAWLRASQLEIVVVVHCNHANELDPALVSALQRLRAAGVTLLNQSVLLRGVNDHVQAQVQLAKALFHSGVLPYYLHLLDKVNGAAHFEVPARTALALHREMAAQLPGYLLPRLVQEIPGQPGKTPVNEWEEN